MITATRTGFSAAVAVFALAAWLAGFSSDPQAATLAASAATAVAATHPRVRITLSSSWAGRHGADDHRHERLVVFGRRRRPSDGPALTQHDGTVGDLRDVLEVVRDQNHR